MKYLHNVATLEIHENKCTGCGVCTAVCPHNVFGIENKKAVIQDLDACMECGACKKNCAFDAISVNAGVGCAAAVITGMVKGTEPTCGCNTDNNTSTCCG